MDEMTIDIDEKTTLRILESKAKEAVSNYKIKNFTHIENKALYVADYLLNEVEYFDNYYATLQGGEESEEIKLLNKLYRIIHSSLDCHSCFDSHDKWRAETEELFEAIVKKEIDER